MTPTRSDLMVGSAWGVLTACLYATVILIWKRLTQSAPTPALGAVVYGICFLTFTVILLASGHAGVMRPGLGHVPLLLLIGVIGFSVNASMMAGLQFSTATKGAILGRTDTLFAAILGSLFIHERLRPAAIPGLLLMFAGALLSMKVSLRDFAWFRPADLLFLFSALCLGCNAVLIRRRVQVVSPTSVAFYNIGVTWMLFTGLGAATRTLPMASALWADRWVALLTVSAGVCMIGTYNCYYRVLRRLPAWTARSFQLLVPPIVVPLSMVFLGESPSAIQVAGMAAVVVGALAVARLLYGQSAEQGSG